jgi:hypothetical protein
MKDPHEIIDQLSPTDALSNLRNLAASDKQLPRRIAEIATAYLTWRGGPTCICLHSMLS